MDIRLLSINDYDSIIALWKTADLPFKPNGRDSKEEMGMQLKKNPDLFIGAFKKDKLIGAIIGTDDGRKGWINRLAISPEHTRSGVATRLIAELEDALKKRGRRIICTLVEDPNEASFALFKKIGYIKHDDIHYLSKREYYDV
jgi:ribosomal protein S18 acetylase RimI-like enzyme